MDLTLLRVLHWLGPTSGTTIPKAIRTSDERIDGRFVARLYQHAHRTPVGAYVVVPGLHPRGPDDPRLDRFCRVLASSGFDVLAPFLPDHTELMVRSTVKHDTRLVWDRMSAHAQSRSLPTPALFSISFGSLPALAVAADVNPSALVLFGGYRDFTECLHFAVSGKADRPHDPLNAPAVAMNMLRLGTRPELDQQALSSAWMSLVHATWGKPELKLPNARDGIANGIAGTLRTDLREPFLRGAGILPGADRELEQVLAHHGQTFAFADPAPYLSRITCPVVIAHGREDDVIPVEQADALANALPQAKSVQKSITGLYSHTGKANLTPSSALTEVKTMLALAKAIARAPQNKL